MENKKEGSFKLSEYMRGRRPELYSTSTSREEYNLSSSVLNHHLSTLTERNEQRVFEDFCRAIAQREICANLRPQTGPEGGGDGKVDTDTYPVDESITDRWYLGVCKSGAKWAFAISAKKAWSGKVRDDVAGIASTKRGYQHIHFFTNQNPRAKKRLEVEKELEENFGIPTTVYDRNWLVEKALNHKDLVYEILGVGELISKPQISPEDLGKRQELNVLEDQIRRPEEFNLTEHDLIGMSLRAAKISRNLECSSVETDGRFSRAIRMADNGGQLRARFVARYEAIWAKVWWEDDLDFANENFDELIEIGLESKECYELERLNNVLTVLATSNSDSPEFKQRSERISNRLQEFVDADDRPNRGLYAETLLCSLSFANLVCFKADRQEFDKVWQQLSEILVRAEGLVEYPAAMIFKFASTMLDIDSDATERLEALFIQAADFMGKREDRGDEGALCLRLASRKMEQGKPLEAIALAGRSVAAFMHKEHQSDQLEALWILGAAYEDVGLNWAARSSYLHALIIHSSLSSENPEKSHPACIPIAKRIVMSCLKCGHLVDAILGIQLLRVFQNTFGLPSELSKRLEEDTRVLDGILAMSILVMHQEHLTLLHSIPDLLLELDLLASNALLLYRLGHINKDSDEYSEVQSVIEDMLLHPELPTLPRVAAITHEGKYIIRTRVMGVEYRLLTDGSDKGVQLCEILITWLEAFTSTLFFQGLAPTTEKALIRVIISEDVAEASSDLDLARNSFSFNWPSAADPISTIKEQGPLLDFGISVFSNVFSIRNESLFDILQEEEASIRSWICSQAILYRNRLFGEPVGRLSDLKKIDHHQYQAVRLMPDIKLPESRPGFGLHGETRVLSVINRHLWDSAQWCGTAYFTHPSQRPLFGVIFTNEQPARQIFEELRERLGEIDSKEEIRVGIITDISASEPHHYCVHISTNPSAILGPVKSSNASSSPEGSSTTHLYMLSRVNKMTPDNRSNLNRFLEEFKRAGEFGFLPCVLMDDRPIPLKELQLVKRNLNVTPAWQIGLQHLDRPASGFFEDVPIPGDIDTAPVWELDTARVEEE